jgi:hypothetical protein
MPTQDVITNRLAILEGQTVAAYAELRDRFEDQFDTHPIAAMDHLGMEVAETQYFLDLVRHAGRRLDDLPGILAHQEMCVLRGDWQPVSPCAMHRALHQAQSLARCKFVKRLREVLKDD